ncbi:SDR family oxidoreductase [Nocardia uniformis]|uniref:3-oxoacyl-[acyl-carrier-protein] reductase MabA n=1 Tax=Nocardia uniformis TaxID=53432 RepID=A0A849BXM5_9NOCA|nr:SDR family oxidoreductase [Nocardia uniformis]NNH69968.1 SDR family oxidoreductase [Nocardia uniformis]
MPELEPAPATGVIVTGAASGIGLAVAHALAEVGRPVALWDLAGASARAAAAAITDNYGVAAMGLGLDVTDTAAVEAAVDPTRSALGSIGGLVHAAGIVRAEPVGYLDAEKWDAVLDVNLRAHALITQAVLTDLQTNPGSAIVGISSIEAFIGQAFIPAYCSSKAGLLGLTRALAHQLGGSGVRVNAICPGFIDTPMMRGNVPEEVIAQQAARSVFARLGAAEEVARAVRFLMSDEASFITGTHLTVDGGVTATGGQ